MTTTIQTAVCLNHPRREAAARCTSCGRPYCRECVTELDGRMVCGPCYKEKTQVKEKPKRDWFVVTTALQALLGLGTLWLAAWLLGQLLVNTPSSFHEATVWEKLPF